MTGKYLPLTAWPEIPFLQVQEIKNKFLEVELNLTEDTAIKEARRCLRCDLETEDGKQALKPQTD